MFEVVDISYYLEHMPNVPVIDVRSPGEFEKGHIPGATNIPLFTNEERAAVGTVYKRKSKEEAIELGYTFVTPKLDYFINKARELTSNSGIVIHCWRGGMRSKAFAEHLANNGIEQVYLIEKGYKAFRTKVLSTFEEEYSLNILGGYTGSGKTEILLELKNQGLQVIDLEGLAKHKGSAFGGIGFTEQPTVEQFENNLFWEWKTFDTSRPIWIEDESRSIGNVLVPQGLYENIREQPVIFIDIPRAERAKFLVTGYGECENTELAAAINRITKRLGGLNAQLALEYLENDDYLSVAELSLSYYDKFYKRGLNKRNPKLVRKIQLETVDPELNANQIRKYIERSTGNN
jgi:tRNA 2-selenouridine synthase